MLNAATVRNREQRLVASLALLTPIHRHVVPVTALLSPPSDHHLQAEMYLSPRIPTTQSAAAERLGTSTYPETRQATTRRHGRRQLGHGRRHGTEAALPSAEICRLHETNARGRATSRYSYGNPNNNAHRPVTPHEIILPSRPTRDHCTPSTKMLLQPQQNRQGNLYPHRFKWTQARVITNIHLLA